MSATGLESIVASPPAPDPGQLVRVRGRMWVVGEVLRDSQAALDDRTVQHLVSLVSVDDDATGEELQVIWEIEPGTLLRERAELPALSATAIDRPDELDANLTYRALHNNLEAGILVEDPALSASIERHIRSLMESGVLRLI